MKWKPSVCAIVALLLCVQQAVSDTLSICQGRVAFTPMLGCTPRAVPSIALQRTRVHSLLNSRKYARTVRTIPRFLTALQSKSGSAARKATKIVKDPIHANTRVLIVGGGIGGLAAALALALRGFQVIVLEKDESFRTRRQGYGLTLQQGGSVLSRLGVSEAVVSASVWSASHFIFDSLGEIVAFWGPTWWKRMREMRAAETGSGEQESAENGESVADGSETQEIEEWRRLAGHNLHIPRQALRDILLQALLKEQPGAVVWGAQVASVEHKAGAGGEVGETEVGDAVEAGRHVAVETEDGRRFMGHCCVAFDGIHSAMRRLLLPHPQPLTYLGHLVVLGIFPNAAFPLAQRRTWQMSDGSARRYGQPFTEQLGMWQLSWPMEEAEAALLARSPRRLREAALARCAAWSAPVPEMVAAADWEGMVSGFPAYDRPAPTPASLQLSGGMGGAAGLCALAGDAAHPMSPFKGQGANQALLDGFCVSEALHRFLSLNQKRWVKDYSALPKPDTRRPPLRSAAAERAWLSARVALALREFEAASCARAAPKVLLSRGSVAQLHAAAFTQPQFHVSRKGMRLETVLALRAAGLTAASAHVAPDHLERVAFARALAADPADHACAEAAGGRAAQRARDVHEGVAT